MWPEPAAQPATYSDVCVLLIGTIARPWMKFLTSCHRKQPAASHTLCNEKEPGKCKACQDAAACACQPSQTEQPRPSSSHHLDLVCGRFHDHTSAWTPRQNFTGHNLKTHMRYPYLDASSILQKLPQLQRGEFMMGRHCLEAHRFPLFTSRTSKPCEHLSWVRILLMVRLA